MDKKSGKPTLLDHFWSNHQLNLIKKAGTFHGISDHFGIYTRLGMEKLPKQNQTIRYRNFKNYDADLFNEDLNLKLKSSKITKYIEQDDVNGATEELIHIMQETADIHAPEIEIKIGKRKAKAPWFSQELTQKIYQKISCSWCYVYFL